MFVATQLFGLNMPLYFKFRERGYYAYPLRMAR
jgi:hypothetical protein